MQIKQLTKEQILISLDRLTRFKMTEEKYLRVFKDIIISNLIQPKYKKNQLDKMNYVELRDIAQEIINQSLPDKSIKNDNKINKILNDYENYLFSLDKNTQQLLDNDINYASAITLIQGDACSNLKWLRSLVSAKSFPIKKLIISEGITEEILLPKFAQIFGYDFEKNGIHIISAGGKNQVVKLFYNFADVLKIPIFVLLDKDAEDNFNQIKPKLKPKDRIYILKNGEFEDILPLDLIKRSLNYGLNNLSILEENIFESDTGMVKILEEIFRHRGLHEFKKAEFARYVHKNIENKMDLSPEIVEILTEIKNL